MAVELLSAGTKLGWAVETTAGTLPTTYVRVRGIKSIPDLNPEPATHQVTDFNDLEYHRYIDGLKDVGGAISFTSNHTNELMTDWAGIVAAYETAKASDLQMWFTIAHPDLDQDFFVRGNPSPLGLGAREVDAPMEIDVYITPTMIHGWDDKATVNEPAVTPPTP